MNICGLVITMGLSGRAKANAVSMKKATECGLPWGRRNTTSLWTRKNEPVSVSDPAEVDKVISQNLLADSTSSKGGTVDITIVTKG